MVDTVFPEELTTEILEDPYAKDWLRDMHGGEDWIHNGYTVTDGGGLTATVAAGKAVIEGKIIERTVSTGLTMTDNATNYIFVYHRSDLRDNTVYFEVNTTDTPPSYPNLKIAEVVTSGGSITTITDKRNLAQFETAGATRPSSTDTALFARVDDDLYDRFAVRADGRILWGDGTATGDVVLYRSAADELKTDDALTVIGSLKVGAATTQKVIQLLGQWGFDRIADAVGNEAYAARISTDTTKRFRIMADGILEWGPGGSSATDANLYRSAADRLATDDELLVIAGLRVGSGGSPPELLTDLRFGSSYPAFISGLTNGDMRLGLWPTGTGTLTALMLHNASDSANVGRMGIEVSGAALTFNPDVFGTGTAIAAIDMQDIQLRLPLTGSTGGLLIGGDANLYRVGADALKTDDAFTAAAGLGCGDGTNLIDPLLRFITERSWRFLASGSGATTVLQLKSEVDGKAFEIVDLNGSAIARFSASTTNPFVELYDQLKLPTTGSTGGILIGGDVQLFRGVAGRLDLASGDWIRLLGGDIELAQFYGIRFADSTGSYNTEMFIDNTDDFIFYGENGLGGSNAIWGVQIGITSPAFRVEAPGGLQIGADVLLSRGAANRLDLASGDSLNLVSGDVTLASGKTVDGADVSELANAFLWFGPPDLNIVDGAPTLSTQGSAYQTWDFHTTGAQGIGTAFWMPRDWDGSSGFTVKIYYRRVNSNSGGVRWEAIFRPKNVGESPIGGDVVVAASQTTPYASTLQQFTIGTASAGNFASDDLVMFRLKRATTHADDTYGSDVEVFAVVIEYTAG